MFSEKLRTKFVGLDMRTPVSVAPHSSEGPCSIAYPEKIVDKLMSYVERGASKVAIQYTCVENLEDYPAGKEDLLRWGTSNDSSPISKDFKYLFIMGDEVACMGRKDVGLKVIDMLKKKVPEGVLVEADVVGRGADPESWSSIAKEFENAGADCIELDTSCPMFAAHEEAKWAALIKEGFPNQQIADNDEAISEIVQAVAKKIKVPFGWKMTPETGWPRFLYLAKDTITKGASWVTCTNNPLVLTPIDIFNGGKPDAKLFPGGSATCLAGAVGYGRAIGRKVVPAIRHWIPNAGIIAITGITKPEYAVEYLMLGADICELASGLFFYGNDFIKQVVKYIDRFMDDYGYNSIDELRGKALEHVEWDGSKFDFKYGQLVAKFDRDACTGCGRCGGSICYAITRDEERKPILDELICAGCGLCTQICPANAVTLVERDKPKVMDLAKGILKVNKAS